MCRPTFSCLHPIRPPRMGCSSETPVSRIPSKKSSKHATDYISRHYATDDISRHPDYSTKLQTLLSTYYLKAREPPEHPCRQIPQRQCGGSLGRNPGRSYDYARALKRASDSPVDAGRPNASASSERSA